MIRYKINPNTQQVSLLPENTAILETVKTTKKWPDELTLIFDHINHIYFVDILEKNPTTALLKVKVYLPAQGVGSPEGQIVGWLHREFLSLHHVGDVFDGRFNRH